MTSLSKIFFSFILLVIFVFSASSQTLNKTWDRVYSGNQYDAFAVILETSDHGLVMAGSSNSGIGGDKTQDNYDTNYNSSDFWIVRSDSNGLLLWEKTFGGNFDETLLDIKETADNGFIIAGNTKSDSSGDVSEVSRGPGYNDYWMIKTDASGNKLWDKRFGGNTTDLLSCITQTADGGYLLGGSSLSPASGDKSNDNHTSGVLDFDFWIVKTDSLGTKLWDKTIGGDKTEIMQAVIPIPSGGLLLGGYSRSSMNGDKTDTCRGEADFWILKINETGTIAWDKTYGGDYTDWLYSMTVTNDGGFALAGLSGSSDSIGEKNVPSKGGSDYWVVKTDSAGIIQWNNVYGSSGDENPRNIIQTQDGGLMIGGTSYSGIGGDKTEPNLGVEQGWIVKTNNMGTYEWDRTVFSQGHDENGFTIQTYDGCYVLGIETDADTGGYKTVQNLNLTDYWIVKFCYQTPMASFYSSDTIFCEKKYIDFFDVSTNNPTAWYWSFPGAVPASSTDQNPTNIYYNTYGVFDVSLIATNAFGSDTLFVTGLIQENLLPPPTVTVSADTLFCSPAYSYQWFIGTTPIPGANGSYYVMTVPGSYSVMISDSLGCTEVSDLFTTGIQDFISANSISAGPNPSDGNFYLNLSQAHKEQVYIEIINPVGAVVYKTELILSAGLNTIPVSFTNPVRGIYFIKVHAKNSILRNKIVIK